MRFVYPSLPYQSRTVYPLWEPEYEWARAHGLPTGLVDLDGQRVPKAGTERTLPADLVLLAMGFTGPERETLDAQLGVPFDDRGAVGRDGDFATSEPGVFVAGDAGRGQSLIVWAIAEGRSAAAGVDAYLEGATELPAPVRPTDRAIAL